MPELPPWTAGAAGGASKAEVEAVKNGVAGGDLQGNYPDPVLAATVAKKSEIITSLDGLSDVEATNPQQGDALLFDGGKWARLAKGAAGQQIVIRSDGTVKYTDAPEVLTDAWGLKGDNATDNTAAAVAMVEAAAPGTTIKFGPGLYKIGELGEALKEKRNISFVGSNYVVDTTGGTVTYSGIVFTGEHDFIDLGAFTTTPANYWQGKSQGFSIERLMLYSSVGNGQNPGERTTIAVRDNGCGNVTIRDCQFLNFQYGFASPYGSDFSVFERTRFSLCDVGMYLGPGSGEDHVEDIDFDRCREGFVADSCQQGYMAACTWEDNAVLDVKFEYLAKTRFGLEGAHNSYNDLNWVLESNKHESNAGQTGVVWSTAPIQTYTDRAEKSYPRGLRIRSPRLVAGGPESATRAFLEATTGRNLVVENPNGQGVAVRYWINRGESLVLRLKNPHTEDGSPEILPFRNENFECLTVNEFSENSVRGATSGAVVTWINTEGVKHQWLFNGATVKLRYWTGTEYLERLSFDAQNARVALREAEISRVAANVFGMVAGTHFRPPKYSAEEAKPETLYIDSGTGILSYKDAGGAAHTLY